MTARLQPLPLCWTLPFPHHVTANHLYRNHGRNRQLTPEHQAWRDEVIVIVRDGGLPVVPSGPLALSLEIYFPDNRRRDVDNCIKGVLDSLAAALVFDDRRVAGIRALRHADPARPRIEARLYSFDEWEGNHG